MDAARVYHTNMQSNARSTGKRGVRNPSQRALQQQQQKQQQQHANILSFFCSAESISVARVDAKMRLLVFDVVRFLGGVDKRMLFDREDMSVRGGP